jgi:hypothetical protein
MMLLVALDCVIWNSPKSLNELGLGECVSNTFCHLFCLAQDQKDDQRSTCAGDATRSAEIPVPAWCLTPILLLMAVRLCPRERCSEGLLASQ